MPAVVGWLDNDQSYLDSHQVILQDALGGIVETTTEPDDLVEMVRSPANCSYVLLDLDMPVYDGIDVYHKIRAINPKIPVAIASVYTNADDWRERLQNLPDSIPKFAKPLGIATSDSYQRMVTDMKTRSHRYRAHGLFNFPISEFETLDKKARRRFFEEARELNQQEITKYFEKHPDIDWVVVAERPGKIVRSGIDADEPYHSDLMTLARDLGVPVFTYTRPKPIEEIPPAARRKWTRVDRSGDRYPTVTLEFETVSGNIYMRGHFDTGSPYSFLSYEAALDSNIVKEAILAATNPSDDDIWGEDYIYYNEPLTCTVVGPDACRKAVQLRCRLVDGWRDTLLGQNYEDRIALIGRNLLTQNRLKLLLDGETHRTYLVG